MKYGVETQSSFPIQWSSYSRQIAADRFKKRHTMLNKNEVSAIDGSGWHIALLVDSEIVGQVTQHHQQGTAARKQSQPNLELAGCLSKQLYPGSFRCIPQQPSCSHGRRCDKDGGRQVVY